VKRETYTDELGVTRLAGAGEIDVPPVAGYQENTPNTVDAAANADVADAADKAESREIVTRRTVLAGSVGGRSSSGSSSSGPTAAEIVKSIGERTGDDELERYAGDSRKTVAEAAKAERARRDAAKGADE
jgi:hypothetical protein